MNAKTNITAKTREYCERAAATFMEFQFNAGKVLMRQTLPKRVQREILEQIAKINGDVLEKDAEKGVDFTINLFGPHQEDFKASCISPVANLRNLINDETWPKNKAKGCPRIIHVMDVAKRMPTYEEKAERCRQAAKEFFPHYDKFAEAGKRQADHNFPFKVTDPKTGIKVRVSELLRYPSRAEFEEAFYVNLSPPQQLPVFDMERAVALPPGYAKKLAAAHDHDMSQQLDTMKAAAIEATADALDALAGQLKNGQRLHKSKVEKAIKAARMLKSFNDGYEKRVGIDKLADVVEERIAKAAESWETFKESDDLQRQAARTAAAVRAKLAAVQKSMAPPADKPKTTKKPINRKQAKAKAKAPAKGRRAAGGLAATV